ncbi:MAG: DUF1559 domain-containing protein [Thermoguttaceae bacterium]
MLNKNRLGFPSFSYIPLCVVILVFFTSFSETVPTAFSQEVFSEGTATSGVPSISSEIVKTVSPLIDDKVALVVYVNLSQIDFDLLLDKIIGFVEESVAKEQIDAQRMTAIRLGVTQNFNYMFRDFMEIRTKLMEEAGVNDLFLIMYSDTTALVPMIIAAPEQGKTDIQKRAFERVIRNVFPITFSDRGFMIGTSPNSLALRDEAEEKIKTKIANLQPVSTESLAPAFAQQADAALVIVGVLPPNAADLISQANAPANISPIIIQLGKFMSQRMQWLSVGFSIKNSSVQVIGQTHSNKDASEILLAIQKASEFAISEIAKKPPENSDVNKLSDSIKMLSTQFTPTVQNDTQLVLLLDKERPRAMTQLLVPLLIGFQTTQQLAWNNQCSQNLKTIGTAVIKYKTANGAYPPPWTVDSNGKPLQSWRVLILPYLDEQELYDSIHLDEPWDSEYNQQFHKQMPSIFRCPASVNANNTTTSYTMIVGPDAFSDSGVPTKPDEITDDLASTIMIIERKTPICWMKTDEISENAALNGLGIDRGAGSDHATGGANALFFDSSVRFIRKGIPVNILKSVITFNGNEPVKLP